MIIVGVESSCDETAAAVVEDGGRILSSVVASQIHVHSPYGGVVPELASRHHVESILPVISQAINESGITMEGIDAIGVTQGPGLVGALLIGISAAKAIAYTLKKPLIGVNHLEGHMQSAFLEREPLDKSFVCLVVSGGHTALYSVDPAGPYRFLGSTRDDAAGEAFDKVAKLLGLGYPGGVVIDRMAEKGDPAAVQFPRAFAQKDSLEFSFSGVKTAVANFLQRHGLPDEHGKIGDYSINDVVASFQEAVVDVLVSKTIQAAKRCGVEDVAVVGGVAANRRLRQRLAEAAAADGIGLHMPALKYCTDNAVMIAAAAYYAWRRSGFSREPLDLEPRSRWL